MKNYLILYWLLFFPFCTQAQVDMNPVWVKQFEGTGSLGGNVISRFDNNNNLYLTVGLSGTLDFDLGVAIQNVTVPNDDTYIVLAKYSSTSTLLWVKTLPCNLYANPLAIAFDASNNLYLTANFQGTLDADPSTNTLELAPQSPLLTSSMFGKYDINGNLLWAKHLRGTSTVQAEAMLLDGNGNLYVSGFFIETADFNPDATTQFNASTSNNESDGFLAKYDSNGGLTWAKVWAGNGVSNITSMELDASANMIVGGYFSQSCDMNPNAGALNFTSSGSRDVFFGKYTALGEPVWVNKLDGSLDDYGYVSVKNNELYVYGLFESPTIDLDASPNTNIKSNVGAWENLSTFFTKYNLSTGAHIWGNAISAYLVGFEVQNSQIFVSGFFRGTIDFDANAGITNLTSPANNFHGFLTKYNTNGIMSYAVSPSGNESSCSKVSFDSNNNLHLFTNLTGTGDFDFTTNTLNATSSASSGNLFLTKYAPPADINLKQGTNNIVIGSAYNVGSTSLNIPKDVLFTIENVGGAPLTINNITVNGDFSLQGVAPNSIAVGSSVNITIRMSANSIGNKSGVLTINSNDVDEAQYIVNLSGSVSSLSQTITFNALPTKTFGDANFSLTATASSGLPIAYQSLNTNVATVSGSTLTIVGAGTANIVASQAGNATYSAANNVTQILLVNKANQTISFASIPLKTVGSPAFNLIATASSGLPVSYTSSNTSVATISGNLLTPINIGTTTVTATQAGNNNYNAATSATQLFQVIPKAPLNLVAVPEYPFKVNLSWNAVAGVVLYRVFRSVTSGSGFVEIGTSNTQSFTDNTVQNAGTTYYYTVKSVVNSLESGFSNEASVVATHSEREFLDASFELMPNPTQNQISIKFTEPLLQNLTYTISSGAGKVLEMGTLPKGQASSLLHLTRYPAGIYILIFQNEAGKTITKKIIKL